MSENGIDFETAEFQDERPRATCAVCKESIASTYWEANGQLVCERCQLGLSQEFNSDPGPGIYVRGFLLGAGAALLGAIGWLVVTATVGYFGLIAIAIGWLVGKAVSVGTARRGGAVGRYIAVALTYLAVISQYLAGALLSDQASTFFVALGQALVAPFAGDFGTSQIIRLAIIGFGLWQAWQTSAPVTITFNGPFRLGDRRPDESDSAA